MRIEVRKPSPVCSVATPCLVEIRLSIVSDGPMTLHAENRPVTVVVGYLNCVYRSVLREQYINNLVAP